MLRKVSILARHLGVVHTFEECLDFRQLLLIRQLPKFCVYSLAETRNPKIEYLVSYLPKLCVLREIPSGC